MSNCWNEKLIYLEEYNFPVGFRGRQDYWEQKEESYGYWDGITGLGYGAYTHSLELTSEVESHREDLISH